MSLGVRIKDERDNRRADLEGDSDGEDDEDYSETDDNERSVTLATSAYLDPNRPW